VLRTSNKFLSVVLHVTGQPSEYLIHVSKVCRQRQQQIFRYSSDLNNHVLNNWTWTKGRNITAR